MINKKPLLLIILAILCVALLCGCASTSARVQKALDKMETYDSVHMKGTANASINMQGTNIDMDAEYDIKVVSEDIQMSMKTKTGFMNLDVEYYFADGKFYMYMPQMFDKYIDASSMYGQMMDEGLGMDLSAFDFDVAATELKPEDVTIDYQGKEVKALKVKVLLNDEQMTQLIKDIFRQQNFSSDTLAGQALNEASRMYESINIASAEYTIYIDEGNNVLRFDVAAEFTMQAAGQNMSYDMVMTYDIIDTGDSVKIELPDIEPEDTVTFEELLSGFSE